MKVYLNKNTLKLLKHIEKSHKKKLVLRPIRIPFKAMIFAAGSPSRLHMLYAKLEEEHGLARHALSIYNRATKAVEEKARCGWWMALGDESTTRPGKR